MNIPQNQIDQADSIDIIGFLQSQGQTILRDGHEFKWKEHDSVSISQEKNVWYQHSTGLGGGVISLCMNFFGLNFQQAVSFLLSESTLPPHKPVPAAEPKKQFCLTRPCSTNKHVVSYLQNVRKISPDILAPFITAGDVYEEMHCTHFNCVFVGRDPAGVARTATRRATAGGYRRDFPGSDKRFGFSHIADSTDLFVFEAAIDLLSFATLFPKAMNSNLLAQGGCTNYSCLFQFLNDHPNIRRVFLGFDNDDPGQKACDHLEQSLPAALTVGRIVPSEGDWNDLLRSGQSPQGRYRMSMRK